MNKPISIFAFDPSIEPDRFAANYRDWGIDLAILHPGYFCDARMKRALDRNNIDLWLNVPVFYDPPFLEGHPDFYSITSQGRRAVHDWCHFVCPRREDYLDNLISERAALAARLQPKIISLDFIRYFVFWEMVDLRGGPERIEDGCYCPVCLQTFEQALGEKIPTTNAASFIRHHAWQEWGQWKSQRITEVASRLLAALRNANPDAKLWIKTVPWKQNDLEGAIIKCVGQDIPALAKLVDGIAPMAFTHILRQSPAWKEEVLAEVKGSTGKPVISYLQVEKIYRPESIPTGQFEAELKAGMVGDWAGISVFCYEQLVEAPEKVGILKRYTKGGAAS
jgi:hypothetical protein